MAAFSQTMQVLLCVEHGRVVENDQQLLFWFQLGLEETARSTDLGDSLCDVVSSVDQFGWWSYFARGQRHKGVCPGVQQTLGHLPFTLGTQKDRRGGHQLSVSGYRILYTVCMTERERERGGDVSMT